MHILADKNVLLENLNTVQKSIPLKSTISALKGILINVKEEELTMVGNNLEMSIKAISNNIQVFKEGEVVLPVEFIEILKQSPDENIEIKISEDDLRTEIISGQANFILYGMNPEDFPLVGFEKNSDRKKIDYSAQEFKNMLKKVTFAVSQDEGKPSFKGVLFEIDEENNVFFIASDTYRLAYLKTTLKNKDLQPLRILVPGKSLNEIMRIIDDGQDTVEFTYTDNDIIFYYKQFIIYSRLLENRFPNLSSIFPPTCATKIKINTRLLEKAIARASLLAGGYNHMISLQITEDTLEIYSGSEVGRMNEKLLISNKEGDDLPEIMLNARYFLDPLKVIDDEYVEINFNGAYGPCIFDYQETMENGILDYRYLVLPIKVDKKDL
ncbi:MAG: DNA polymerase III subunit beta [Dethiobacteria bacterium]|jgi:DNA polymerase-3 subunit beta